jgi:predicted RNA-binding protein YlxR (DUF448 family)
MQKKKIPIRMCAGCREGRHKKDLVRVVKGPDGDISVDITGKKPGRGAYICRDARCLARARRARCFERAFGCEISGEIYDRLGAEIEDSGDDGGQ